MILSDFFFPLLVVIVTLDSVTIVFIVTLIKLMWLFVYVVEALIVVIRAGFIWLSKRIAVQKEYNSKCWFICEVIHFAFEVRGVNFVVYYLITKACSTFSRFTTITLVVCQWSSYPGYLMISIFVQYQLAFASFLHFLH